MTPAAIGFIAVIIVVMLQLAMVVFIWMTAPSWCEVLPGDTDEVSVPNDKETT